MNAHTPLTACHDLPWPPSTRRLNALIAKADAADRALNPRLARTPAHFDKVMPNDTPTTRRNAIELLASDAAEYAVACLLDVLACARADDREAFLDGVEALNDELRGMAPEATDAAAIMSTHDRTMAQLRNDPDYGDWLRDQREDR